MLNARSPHFQLLTGVVMQPPCVAFRRVAVSFWGPGQSPVPHTVSGRCVLLATAACVPADVVSMFAEPSSWRTGVVLVVAGVVFRSLLPTPLRMPVVHHLPRCVSMRMWSVTLLFLHGALGSHPFFPSCCVGSLWSDGRYGLCSLWCCFRVRGAQ